MKVRNNRGAITIFLCIVLSAILLVIGIFTDAARISLAHSQIQRACKAAMISLLAGYNNELKDQYGLFGIYVDSDSIKEEYEEYLNKNLNITGQNFLYDFKLENTDIYQQRNLEDRNVFRTQVKEFMKYRAPYEIASDLIKKISEMKNISGAAKVFKRIIGTDKLASIVGNLQIVLEDKAKKINELGLAQKVSEIKVKLLGETSKNVQGNLNSINNVKQNIKSDFINTVIQFRNLNLEAIDSAKAITEKKGELLKKIDEELKSIEESKQEATELLKGYQDDLSNLQKLIGEDNSENITAQIQSNIQKCEGIMNKTISDDAGFLSEMDNLQFSSINYIFNKAKPVSTQEKDNRDKAGQAQRKALSQSNNSKAIDSGLIKQLPSRNMRIQQNEKITNEEGIYSDINGFNTNIDFRDENNANILLEELSMKESIFDKIISDVTEELYVNEYILGIFKQAVPILKGEEDKDSYNFRSEDKTKRNAYFSKYEVEYIINGNEKEETNFLLTKARILAIRLAANIIHIYADKTKMSRVTSLAASLSAWNSGLTTALFQTMLIFSWAMLESVYDVEQLTKGGKILLFKTESQWKTDISGNINKNKTNSSKSDNNPLLLSYQDYLKVFLILMDKEKKLARVQDLVQLNIGVSNTGFLLADCNVMLNTNTTVSIKNLFVSNPFYTMERRKKISRSCISEEMCVGY